MGAGVRPEIDPLEQLKALKAPAAHADPLEQLKAMKPVAPTNYDGSTPVSNAATSALDGLTFGLSKKLIAGGSAAIDAAQAKAEGKPFFDTLGQAYKQDLHAQEAGADQYHAAHPVMDTAAQLAGGGLGIAATGGLGAAKGALQAGRLARYGKAIGTGAAYGAASAAGHSDAVENGQGPKGLLTDALRGGGYGAAAGAASIPVSAVGGKILSALHVPQGLSSLAGAVSRVAPEGSGLQRGAQAVGEAFGGQGPATQTIARLSQMDADAGFVPPSAKKAIPTPLNKNLPRQMGTPMDGYTTAPLIPRTTGDPSMGGEPVTDMAIPARPGSRVVPNLSKYKPAPMALDEAGPNVQGFAEQMAHRPGEAGARIQTAIRGRLTTMRPNVANALTDATGTTPAEGEALLKQIADEQAKKSSAEKVAGAITAEAKRLKPAMPTTPGAAWDAEIGGKSPNAIAELQQMAEAQRTEAKQLYGAARDATRGQPISSPALDKIEASPVGKAALDWGRTQSLNRNGQLPTITQTTFPARMQQMLDEAKPADYPKLLEQFKATGASETSSREVPDPEVLHYAKQRLAKLARLGVRDGQGGTIATQAEGALQQFGAIKGEMPEVWNAADDAFAKHARTMDMLNAGRGLSKTLVNPVGGAQKKALFTSLDALEQRVAQASPEEQHAFRVGGQFDMGRTLQQMPPAKALRELSNPTSDLSRRVALATGDKDAPARLAQRLTPLPQQIPAAPPVPQLSAGARAGQQGVDALSTPSTPSESNPGRFLAALRDTKRLMPSADQATMQLGAAQAARGELNGASGSMKSPGRVFDFTSPERSEQLGHAFPTPAHADAFKNFIGEWDKAEAQKETMLGNSATARRGAFQNEKDIVRPGSIVGRPRMILRSLINGLDDEHNANVSAKMQAEAAKILTSPNPAAIGDATRAGMTRGALLQALRLGAAGDGGAAIGKSKGPR